MTNQDNLKFSLREQGEWPIKIIYFYEKREQIEWLIKIIYEFEEAEIND